MAAPTLQKVQTDLSKKSKLLVSMIMDAQYTPVAAGDRWDLQSKGKLLQSASILTRENVPPSKTGPHLEFRVHGSTQTFAGSLYSWFKSVIIHRVEKTQGIRVPQKDYSKVLAKIPWEELVLVHMDSGANLDTHLKQFDAHRRKQNADKKQTKRFVRPIPESQPPAKRIKTIDTDQLKSMISLESLRSMVPKKSAADDTETDAADMLAAEDEANPPEKNAGDADVANSNAEFENKEKAFTQESGDAVKDKMLDIINNQEALINRMARLRMRNIHLADDVNKKDTLLRDLESIRSSLEIQNCALQTCCASYNRELVDKDATIAEHNCRIKTLQTRNDYMAERLAKRNGEIQLMRVQLRTQFNFFRQVTKKMEELLGPYEPENDELYQSVSGAGVE